MKATVINQTIRNLLICVSASSALVACGGSSGTGGSAPGATLLADGEACAAAWASATAYNGGTKVSRNGRNYTAAYWTQGNDPLTNSGPAGSGQYWITGYLCGSGTPTPAPTPAPAPAPTPTPTPAPTPTPTPAPTPTPTPAGCTYQTWASGTNYPLGTIVKYPANGNFYKEVNAGTNGSDGTDPTISTWYWAATTCSSTPTPTPAPTPTPTPTSGAYMITENQFNQMFPGKGSFYTYAGLVAAANSISGFGSTGSDTAKKQEVAAFLANVAHETGGLVYVVEQNTANYGSYCDLSQSYGCPAGTAMYYGRGPLQLSWNFNYKLAGDYLGVDLLHSPGLVASDPTISWRSAMWYWMTQTGPASVSTMSAHAGIVNGYGFGQTIKSINGDIECVGGTHYAGSSYMQDRVNSYNSFVGIIGVTAGSNVSC